MKIVVNTRFLIKDSLEGIGRYTFEILKRMVLAHPEDEFHFIFDRPYSDEFIFAQNVTPIVVSPQARHKVLWKIWFELKIPKIIKRIKPDVFLSFDGYTSLRAKCNKITVIHDLAFEHYPKFIPIWAAKYYKKYTPRFIQASNKVVAVSNFTKADIIDKYDIGEEKIEVIENASEQISLANNIFTQEVEDFLEDTKYFLYLGAVHPRKNIAGLLKAFDKFRHNNFRKIKLVVAGRNAWGNEDLQNLRDSLDVRHDIKFLNVVPEELKNALYQEAEGFLYCSFFEGFGIPILEAQQLGCPVITSDTSSMPEVAGEGALYCNPSSVDSISEQMGKLVNEPGLRESLIKKGNENAKRYSWDESASKMYMLIKNVAEAKTT